MKNTILSVKGLVGLTAKTETVEWDFHTGQRRTVMLDSHTRYPLHIVSTENGWEFKRNGCVVVLPIKEILDLLDKHADELKDPTSPDYSAYSIT